MQATAEELEDAREELASLSMHLKHVEAPYIALLYNIIPFRRPFEKDTVCVRNRCA